MLRAFATAGLSEVEMRVVKATWDDDFPPKAKHVEALLRLTTDHDLVPYLDKRIAQPKWNVVLKCLILLHKCSTEGAERFVGDLTHHEHYMELGTFVDVPAVRMSPHAKLIKKYAEYLSEKVFVFKTLNTSAERKAPQDAKKWAMAMSNTQLAKALPSLQIQFDKLILCMPYSEDDMEHVITVSAISLLIKDAFRLYSILTIQMLVVLEKFESMDLAQTELMLAATERFLQQNERFKKWTQKLVKLELINASLMPNFDAIPPTFLQLLKDHIDQLNSGKKRPIAEKEAKNAIDMKKFSYPEDEDDEKNRKVKKGGKAKKITMGKRAKKGKKVPQQEEEEEEEGEEEEDSPEEEEVEPGEASGEEEEEEEEKSPKKKGFASRPKSKVKSKESEKKVPPKGNAKAKPKVDEDEDEVEEEEEDEAEEDDEEEVKMVKKKKPSAAVCPKVKKRGKKKVVESEEEDDQQEEEEEEEEDEEEEKPKKKGLKKAAKDSKGGGKKKSKTIPPKSALPDILPVDPVNDLFAGSFAPSSTSPPMLALPAPSNPKPAAPTDPYTLLQQRQANQLATFSSSSSSSSGGVAYNTSSGMVEGIPTSSSSVAVDPLTFNVTAAKALPKDSSQPKAAPSTSSSSSAPRADPFADLAAGVANVTISNPIKKKKKKKAAANSAAPADGEETE